MRLWEYRAWANSDALEFKGVFYSLLHDADPEIRKTMVGTLEDWVTNFLGALSESDPDTAKTAGTEDEADRTRTEFVWELMDHLVSLGETLAVQNPFAAKPKASGPRRQFPANASWWRLRLEFYSQLWALFDALPQEAVKQAFFEAARYDFLNGAEPLRKRWAVLLAKIIYSELLEEERQEMLSTLIEELEDGSYIQRRWLLEFYENSILVFSKRYWIKYWYKGFIKFAHDKIPVLRIKFSKSAQNIWKLLTRKDTQINFIDSVDVLLEDLGNNGISHNI